MRWLSLMLYSAVLLYGLGFAFSPTIFSGFRQMQNDPGDTVLNHYFLEHTWRWVSQREYKPELWSPAFFYPENNVLAYSDKEEVQVIVDREAMGRYIASSGIKTNIVTVVNDRPVGAGK